MLNVQVQRLTYQPNFHVEYAGKVIFKKVFGSSMGA
jgi:hypothetical protein